MAVNTVLRPRVQGISGFGSRAMFPDQVCPPRSWYRERAVERR